MSLVPSGVEDEPLPDHAAESEYGAPEVGDVLNPMAVNGISDIEGLRGSLLHKIQIAVDQSSRPLAADWPDIWLDILALTELYDVRAIWDRQCSAENTQDTMFEWFLRLVSVDADDWDLSSSGTLQSTVHHGCLWSRALTDMLGFLRASFSLSSNAVVQCFDDNHLSLARTCFRLNDAGGEVRFRGVRWTLLVAMSGAGKNSFLRCKKY